MTRICQSGDANVVHLTLTNPAQRNVLDEEWWQDFARVLSALERLPSLKVITLTGHGAAFSAGGDIARMRESLVAMDAGTYGPAERRRKDRNSELLCRWIELPAIRIAAINGPAVGAGLALAMSCDYRLMADDAFLDTEFARIGLPGDLGITYFLPRLIGTNRAKSWLIRPRRIATAEALSLGLADEIFATDQLQEALDRVVNKFQSLSPYAIEWVRNAYPTTPGLREALECEKEATVTCKESDFHRSAVVNSSAGSKHSGRMMESERWSE